MNDFNNNKKRHFGNQQSQINQRKNLGNCSQNSMKNLYQKNMELNPKAKINAKNIQKNIIDDYGNKSIYKEKTIDDTNPNLSKTYYHRKNYYSKDLTNYYPTNNSYAYLTNNSSDQKNFKKYNTKYSMYSTSLKKDNNFRDHSMNDQKKKFKTNMKMNYLGNSRKYSNTSYDFKKIKYKMPNTKEERRIPVIVVSKKPSNKTAINFLKKRKFIIRIQSAWRGYFLRKIAIGSIKKYIGFIALVKYLEKVFYNNINYIFYEFLFLMKKYSQRMKKKYIYKKANNKDNKFHIIRYRNKINMNDKTNNTNDSSNNVLGDRALKTNLFKSQEFEKEKSEFNTIDGIQSSNKKNNMRINNNFIKINNEKKEKENNNKSKIFYGNINASNVLNNTDIIYKPKKVVYIPKKSVTENKPFTPIQNKSKIKNMLMIIKNKYYFFYYPILLYKLKILQKLHLIKSKLESLSKLIKYFSNKHLKKKYLQKYRDNTITLKVEEELFKLNKEIDNTDKIYDKNNENDQNDLKINKSEKELINNKIYNENNQIDFEENNNKIIYENSSTKIENKNDDNSCGENIGQDEKNIDIKNNEENEKDKIHCLEANNNEQKQISCEIPNENIIDINANINNNIIDCINDNKNPYIINNDKNKEKIDIYINNETNETLLNNDNKENKTENANISKSDSNNKDLNNNDNDLSEKEKLSLKNKSQDIINIINNENKTINIINNDNKIIQNNKYINNDINKNYIDIKNVKNENIIININSNDNDINKHDNIINTTNVPNNKQKDENIVNDNISKDDNIINKKDDIIQDENLSDNNNQIDNDITNINYNILKNININENNNEITNYDDNKNSKNENNINIINEDKNKVENINDINLEIKSKEGNNTENNNDTKNGNDISKIENNNLDEKSKEIDKTKINNEEIEEKGINNDEINIVNNDSINKNNDNNKDNCNEISIHNEDNKPNNNDEELNNEKNNKNDDATEIIENNKKDTEEDKKDIIPEDESKNNNIIIEEKIKSDDKNSKEKDISEISEENKVNTKIDEINNDDNEKTKDNEEKNIIKSEDQIINIVTDSNEKEIIENDNPNSILRGKNKDENKRHSDLSSFLKLINKKIEIEKKADYNKVNAYFNIWNNKSNKIEDEKITDNNIKRLLPENKKDKRNKKRHIKVKFSRAMTSKTSISSKKSEDKSNISDIPLKKMKIKNIVVNPTEYYRYNTIEINKSISLNNINIHDIDYNPNALKLIKLIVKIENKNIIFRYFNSWKKNKK